MENPAPSQPASTGMSDDTKTIVTVVLLVFVFPIGFFFMWFWAKWKAWVKLLVTVIGCLPFIIIILSMLGVVAIAALNPAARMPLEQQNMLNNLNEQLPESLPTAPMTP